MERIKRPSEEEELCRFNEEIPCSPANRRCDRCGWNPKVAQERLERICKEKGIYLPPEYRKGK